MHSKHWIYYAMILGLLCGWTACNDEAWVDPAQPEVDLSLLGRGVNFNASYVEPFLTKSTTYNSNGAVNSGDILTIFRQYSKDGGRTFDEADEAYRVYHYNARTASGGAVVLSREWMVKPGEWGCDQRDKGEPFKQTEADSLIWETNVTTRFRAWGLSNYAGALNNKNAWSSFYPDFTVTDWVPVSGPTEQLSLPLRHLGCRISFVPKPGNRLFKVVLCRDEQDYTWDDNAGEDADNNLDNKDKYSNPADIAAKVKAVYDRMCMPGGVDKKTGNLLAMSQAYKDAHPTGPDFQGAKFSAIFKEMVKYPTDKDVATAAVRPDFALADNKMYMITIPYDMQTGHLLTLPPETRFRIYIRDVNGGDLNQGSEWEGKEQYHIFSLSDIEGFEKGLQLQAGYSYEFTVGYHYNRLQIELSNTLSWNDQDARTGTATVEPGGIEAASTKLGWWKGALQKAAESMSSSTTYDPQFEISTAAEFEEFLKLVNGEWFPEGKEELFKASRAVVNPDRENDDSFKGAEKYVWWYKESGIGPSKLDTTFSYRSDLEAEGYIFYKEYHPSNGDQTARVEETYLSGPYSFHDNRFDRGFTVKVMNDIDFTDYRFTAPVGKVAEGKDAAHPFGGIFRSADDKLCSLRNLNVEGDYLFGYVEQGAVIGLRIEGTHPIGVVDQGTKVYLLGLSLKTNSPQTGGLAASLTGSSYVVGCIQEGNSGGPLVGSADNLLMYGCMQTLPGLTGGALLGGYASGAKEFFKPLDKPKWGGLMCSYYDISRSPQARPVGGKDYTYLPQQYVRGLRTTSMCGLKDFLLERPGHYDHLTPDQKIEFYGLAPWKAMNAAIYAFNQTALGQLTPCPVQFEMDAVYTNRYPRLKAGKPTEGIDVLKQYN